MNRSILIVICDFLLVSLLAFSSVDIGKTVDQQDVKVKTDIATTPAPAPTGSRQDVTDVMRMALSEERKGREQLLGELAKSRDASMRTQAQLSEREKQVQTFQQQLQTRQQEQANLQRQYAAAETNIQSLSQRLQATSVENQNSKQALAATAAEVRRKSDEAAALQKKLDDLAKANQQALEEKQKLAGQLQVSEAEKRSAKEMATRMQEEVKVEREEKAKLAEGVKALASRSGELAQELRDNRPLPPNVIFNEVVSNRVQASFQATRSTVFDSDRRRETQTVLVGDGTNVFALCHVQDTPLVLLAPGTEWEGLTGTLARNASSVPIHAMSFYMLDPRVVLMRLSPAEVRQLGVKVYHLSNDPFKFQDSVVVGTRGDYYGECKFEVDLSTPQYVKMDHNSLKGLFGKFNPSRGDLVFSRTGDLIGVMANSTYCMLVHNLEIDMTIQFGPDVRDQHTGSTLSILSSLVLQKPFKLQ